MLKIAIDLGTSSTKIYEIGSGIVLHEPSCVAVNAETKQVKAIGNEAKALVGKTVGENKFLSTSYNGFKNAPQNTKQIFDSRAVKINYKVKSNTQSMMQGKGAGGDFGEIILSPTNGKANSGGKITDVRLTGQMVRRQGTQRYNQPRIEIDIEIG